MIKIVAENYIKEEHQKEFLKLTKELVILSRKEAGNISRHSRSFTLYLCRRMAKSRSY